MLFYAEHLKIQHGIHMYGIQIFDLDLVMELCIYKLYVIFFMSLVHDALMCLLRFCTVCLVLKTRILYIHVCVPVCVDGIIVIVKSLLTAAFLCSVNSLVYRELARSSAL